MKFGMESAIVVGVLAALLLGSNIQPHLDEPGRILMWIVLLIGLPGAVVLKVRGYGRKAGVVKAPTADGSGGVE